ncbi:LacI family DNA-binding transcriptional regulator [Vibrio parahaemolyticus]|uniref:LacI family DNA-binding transcriptional regulator n=1 Tax=Vibrio parahaemolyticus TaxID=670 RepID=UPI00186A9C34|nr:LacI family DNA-binding transcriptional regulator [Vibrio parahaemolyticus]EGQ8233557.1 LacI family DNA-binding transcriptional regulator [Vibrio parahaemolyticus]EHG1303128.1 LacI family DNA-binding transcriptional regulator [Vibrio parahaemolyticus]MBE3932211.1 LacI family DNA-binding transcriptional regulator [Vibrio parahaemolyticus]MBE4043111.1 LacI family DNA-binding transcriptional regulator [Vibrio parahaemolyticus]MCG6442917.1 LacI family DNA-binding transcriptional regulator [Vibr
MARIKDVAELAGVNRSTVSRIINGEGKFREETRRKVEQAMAQLNYRPSAIARSLATSSSNMVGLLVTYYTGGFFGEMMEQVQTELDIHKKFLITAQGHHSAEGEKEAIQRFNDLRCDGYVLHSRYLSDDDLRELAKLPTPFVLLDRYVEGIEERCITFNHHHASRIAVEHLIAGGHKNIACITGPSLRHNSLLRKLGYVDAMKTAGIDIDESWCEEGNYGRQSGYDAMASILKRHPEVTAVFSCSEEMTVGAMQYLHEHKISVPEQISLTSFDSVDLCESLYPTVSAVHFPISDMARAAVQTLMGLVKKQEHIEKPVFEAKLKLRHADRVLKQDSD